MTTGNSFIVLVSNSGLTQFNCLPGTSMKRYRLRMRGQNTRTRYLTHVELTKNTRPPDPSYLTVLQ